jgi:hypothetical protein
VRGARGGASGSRPARGTVRTGAQARASERSGIAPQNLGVADAPVVPWVALCPARHP